jgi:DNA-binding transcriptional LysR family regulator
MDRSDIMTIRYLKIFVTVADCKSMTAASEALFISQPTVSQAISELENYYGIKLFDRLSKKLYITENGKHLLSYARHIIALYEEMELSLKDPEKSGAMKIGASVTIGADLLPQLVNEFEVTRPDVSVSAVIKNTTEIENLIIKNDIDFALVEGIVHNSSIVSKPYIDDELVLVCGKSHPLYDSGSISISGLVKYDFVVREQGSGTRELFESAMVANSVNWKQKWECAGSDVLKSAAVHGIGIAVISKRLVDAEVKAGEISIIRVQGIDLKRKFSIVYHKNKYITETMKAFFDIVHNPRGL